MIGNVFKLINWLHKQSKDVMFEIKEYKPKRSLSQNAYCWQLIGKIADIQRLKKEDVYLQMLKDYGQFEIVSILASVNPKGFIKYYEEIGTGQINGKEFKHYKVYKGSSEFDSKEMSILIDGVIQEAKQYDIETLTPEQIRRMRLI